MTGHIILCGQGKVGFSTLQLLCRLEEPVVVVARDIDRDWEERAERLATRTIRKDARLAETLMEAQIGSARALIAVTDSDLKNLAIALEARRLAPQLRVVLRVHDEALAHRVRDHIPGGTVLNSADLATPAFVAAALGDDVLRAYDLDGTRLIIFRHRVADRASGVGDTLAEVAGRLRCIPLGLYRAEDHTPGPAAADRTLTAGDELVAVAVRRNPETDRSSTGAPRRPRVSAARWVRARKSPLQILHSAWRNAWRPLRVASVAFTALLFASVVVYRYALHLSWLDAAYFTVSTLTTVGYGDINLLHARAAVKVFGCVAMLTGAALFVIYFTMLTDYIVTRRFEEALGKPLTTLSDHFIVVGLGNVGHRIARRLHKLGLPVIAIEQNRETPFAAGLPVDFPVVYGDAATQPILEQAGASRARAILGVTDDDVANFRVAHIAEAMRPGIRTIVRVFDTTLAAKLSPSLLGIDRTLSPSQAAAGTFAAAALADDVLQGFTIGDRLLMLRRVHAAGLPGCAGLSMHDLTERMGIVVLLRQHADQADLEELKPDDVFGPDDTLIVVEQYDAERHASVPCAVTMLTEPETADDVAAPEPDLAAHSLR